MNHLISLSLKCMIYDLLIVFSIYFMTAPMEVVALNTSRIYFIDSKTLKLTKYVIMLAKNLNFYEN